MGAGARTRSVIVDALTRINVRNIRVRSGRPLARRSGTRVFMSVVPRKPTSSNVTCLGFCLRRSTSGRTVLGSIHRTLSSLGGFVSVKRTAVRRSRARSGS